MLGKKLIDPQRPGGSLQPVKGRVAFVQANGVAEVVEDGKKFAESPHAALIKQFAGATTLAPQPLECPGIGPVLALTLAPSCVLDFKKIAALRASEVGPSFRTRYARTASKTP